MSTKINIIITENFVYATYVETICFKGKYSDEDKMWNEIDKARSIAFGYALGFYNVSLKQIVNHKLKTDNDIFEYLKLNN